MKIAAMYWHTLSAWRLNQEPTLLKNYHGNMNVGHHAAYERVMGLAAGEYCFEETIRKAKAEESDLEYSILAYGIACLLSKSGSQDEALSFLESIIRRDEFCISFAYIAAWNDYKNPLF